MAQRAARLTGSRVARLAAAYSVSREKMKGARGIMKLFRFRFELGHFVDLAIFVVGGPFAGLLAFGVKVAGAHNDAVFAEPFPIAGHGVAGFLAFGPDGSVFVVSDVLFRRGGFFGHSVIWRMKLGGNAGGKFGILAGAA